MPDADEPSVGRRGFFREALSGVVRPLAAPTGRQSARREPVRLLRPPGALAEEAFAATCRRCGKCVEVCPAKAIFPLTKSEVGESGSSIHGTPVIDPSAAACVVCSDLACTHACPSGALRPLTRPDEIRMGLAMVRSDVCVRSAGEACRECVVTCPIGPAAIGLPDDGPPRVRSGCVGCGVCEFFCPATPKAIWIDPRGTTGGTPMSS